MPPCARVSAARASLRTRTRPSRRLRRRRSRRSSSTSAPTRREPVLRLSEEPAASAPPPSSLSLPAAPPLARPVSASAHTPSALPASAAAAFGSSHTRVCGLAVTVRSDAAARRPRGHFSLFPQARKAKAKEKAEAEAYLKSQDELARPAAAASPLCDPQPSRPPPRPIPPCLRPPLPRPSLRPLHSSLQLLCRGNLRSAAAAAAACCKELMTQSHNLPSPTGGPEAAARPDGALPRRTRRPRGGGAGAGG